MRYIAIVVVFGLCACEDGPVPLLFEDRTGAAPSGALEELVNRVWTQPDSADLPGVMRIFLADGTLVQDSCWETHRLSLWRMELGGALVWDEDGATIKADVVSLSEDELVLRLHLVGGAEEQRYVAAPVPYVCPDVRR
jgi:hypothetical protein